MNRLRAATLCTPNLKDACARYTEHLDYAVKETGFVGESLAESWNAPASAGRPYAVLGPSSGAPIYIRFIEEAPVEDYAPLRTYGWAAIEICIRDVAKVNARMLSSPFTIIGPPKLIDGLPTIHPMQVRGPDGEIVYLTEIKDLSAGSGLPKPASLVDHLFILVIACSDMEASGNWFRDRLGFTVSEPMSLIYTMINDSFALPADAKHRLTTGSDQGDIFLEFDEYPGQARPRPRRPGALAPGIALGTLTHHDLDALDLPWIRAPAPREGAIYAGRRVGSVEGPDRLLLEIVEG